jgi:hypothetical protein
VVQAAPHDETIDQGTLVKKWEHPSGPTFEISPTCRRAVQVH